MSADVVLHPGESQESLLRRFQKIVQTSGILKEFKVHQRFMTNAMPICSKPKIMPEGTNVRTAAVKNQPCKMRRAGKQNVNN